MATKKQGRYVVIRDVALPDRTAAAGETVDLTEEDAQLLIRDGMVRPAEEETK